MTNHASASCNYCGTSFHGTGWTKSRAQEEANDQKAEHEPGCGQNPDNEHIPFDAED